MNLPFKVSWWKVVGAYGGKVTGPEAYKLHDAHLLSFWELNAPGLFPTKPDKRKHFISFMLSGEWYNKKHSRFLQYNKWSPMGIGEHLLVREICTSPTNEYPCGYGHALRQRLKKILDVSVRPKYRKQLYLLKYISPFHYVVAEK